MAIKKGKLTIMKNNGQLQGHVIDHENKVNLDKTFPI
jgi:hypothetical protein